MTSPLATADGLTTAEVEDRRRRSGPNVLPQRKPPPPWRQLVAQLTHFFAVLLWVAAILAVVAGLPELGIAIAVVVVLNGIFAFAQQHRADRAAERLRDLLPTRVRVRRDGVLCVIDAADLVEGDVVLLDAGDRVSADLRVVVSHGLAVDVSTLTGESVPSHPDVDEAVYAGTFVVEGGAVAVVTAIGGATELAGIAALSDGGHRPPSPLTVELQHVVSLIARMAVGFGLAFFGVSLALGTEPTDGFLLAVGVTVALVPEGLLPTVTLSLAIGAQRMAHRNALVRRLDAVSTLGSTTFVCTDKTGTLTRNEMEVVAVWTPVGRAHVSGEGYAPDAAIEVVPDPGISRAQSADALDRLALAAARDSAGRARLHEGRWVAEGDPMEAALDVLATRLSVDTVADEVRRPQVARYPFDPHRRMMSTVLADEVVVKGAPDAVLPRCTGAPSAAHGALDEMTARGLRVLAIARRAVDATATVPRRDAAEDGLELLGLVGLEDPPRHEVADAIAACRAAGVAVAMVTGDHPGTAQAIAAEVGLSTADSPVVEGRDLPDDEDELGALLDHDGIVLARIDPESKLRIARALRGRGHVVAMTGDGVNDGPALREADIGVAMGLGGTDVAREAADLVLLDDDFATIVAAIEHGRATFANIRRFLTYHLTDNVAELTPFVLWAVSGGQFPLALGVLQVLCLDIGTDLLPALALGAEPPDAKVMARPPWRLRDLEGSSLPRVHLLDRSVVLRSFGLLGPTEAMVEMLAFVVALAAAGWWFGDPEPSGSALAAASGAAFAAVVLGQMANAFACRSTTRRPGELGWGSNPLLVRAVAAELVICIGFFVIPPVASALGQEIPSAGPFVVALLAVPAVLLADALQKAVHRRRRNADEPTASDLLP